MILGCIADDFTGASDAASFLVKGGMRTILFNGIPEQINTADLQTADAAVIALKTRTQETTSAVEDSLSALRWLQKQGAKQFYVKYCSTFDSTPQGNIGPICDAAMEMQGVPYTLLCPSLPVNGRTVERGVLYVNGVPLAESHMKDHPLTPMHESEIVTLMKPQSRYESQVLLRESLQKDIPSFDGHGYLVPDYSTDADGEAIVDRFGDLTLLTGGSGLLLPLAKYLSTSKQSKGDALTGSEGQGILLAGSCSKATRGQIARFKEQGGASFKLDPAAILENRQSLQDVKEFLEKHVQEPVLIYSSETPDYLNAIRGEVLEAYSKVLENTLAATAVTAREMGIRHIIVAGGETSGAVTKALGYQAYWIGPSVAPGVPMMAPLDAPDLRLVLKSGNFGQEDFFERALQMTSDTKKGE